MTERQEFTTRRRRTLIHGVNKILFKCSMCWELETVLSRCIYSRAFSTLRIINELWHRAGTGSNYCVIVLFTSRNLRRHYHHLTSLCHRMIASWQKNHQQATARYFQTSTLHLLPLVYGDYKTYPKPQRCKPLKNHWTRKRRRVFDWLIDGLTVFGTSSQDYFACNDCERKNQGLDVGYNNFNLKTLLRIFINPVGGHVSS